MLWVACLLVFSVSLSEADVGRLDVFGTKTPYEWAQKVLHPRTNEGYNRNSGHKRCQAVHLNMLMRHGARYPGGTTILNSQALTETLRRRTYSKTRRVLKHWNTPYSMKLAKQLLPKGAHELHGIGRRVGQRFQHLFRRYSDHIQLVSSSTDRTQESSRNFFSGLNASVPLKTHYDNKINDSLLRFDANCNSYHTHVINNVTHFSEFHKYHRSPEFVKIQTELGSRLGLDKPLTEDEIYLVNELCSYNKYIQGVESFWCDLLTDQDRQILEYGQDLETYYELSYGHPINAAMSCPLVSDMFQTMDKALNDSWNYDSLPQDAIDKGYLAGKFMFGHSQTLIPVLTALDLYHDPKPLLASNRASLTDRQFRSSHISPFAANIAFVVYSCEEPDSPSTAASTFMIQLYVNERVIQIPGCQGDMCPYNYVRNRYSDLIDHCDIASVCS